MNKLLTSAALLGVLASTAAIAEENMDKAPEGKVKCYGIAQAGKNDCKSADGKHGCAGKATEANNKNEWQFATSEECAAAKGTTETPAEKH